MLHRLLWKCAWIGFNLAICTTGTILAQESYCAHGVNLPHMDASSIAELTAGLTADVPSTGTFKALVVFFRFLDDTIVDNGCTQRSQEWDQPNDLPEIEEYLLSSTATAPFDPRSLTSFYYEQSNENFILYGDIYPEVVVATENESEYNFASRVLTQDILDQIDADVDFSDYDDNGDGYVDHIFMVPRISAYPHAGISWLGVGSDLVYDSVNVDMNLSGSYNRYNSGGIIFPELDLTRLLAHEFGHDIWTNSILGGNHLYALQGENDVPGNGSDRHGYGLMVGAQSGVEQTVNTRGDMIISAYERFIMETPVGDEWIDCSMLSSNTSATIDDLYTTNDCLTVTIPTTGATPERTIFLSNRQEVGFFDQLQFNPCQSSYHGLMTTGLLATVGQEDAVGNHPRFGVIAADNDLALSIDAGDYEGDLWDYDPNPLALDVGAPPRQLTPWTRPNISGYSQYPASFTMQAGNWQALDDIQHTGGSFNEMGFDFVSDFRSNPIIRNDSWIGEESSGTTFSADMIVTGLADLTIEAGTELTFASNNELEVNGSIFTEGTALSPVEINGGDVEIFGDAQFVNTDFDVDAFTIQSGAEVVISNENGLTLEHNFVAELGSELLLTASPIASKTSPAPVSELDVRHTDVNDEEENQDELPGEANATTLQVPSEDAIRTQAYPNPFNPTVTIQYHLPAEGHVTLSVYNVLGQEIETLVSDVQAAGSWEFVWEGTDSAGRAVPSGIYVYRIQAGDRVESGKVILLK